VRKCGELLLVCGRVGGSRLYIWCLVVKFGVGGCYMGILLPLNGTLQASQRGIVISSRMDSTRLPAHKAPSDYGY
jgi:hypothetical protein